MTTDKFVIRVVVVTIATCTVLSLLGMLAMAYRGDLSEQSIKEVFLLVAGALIAVIARTTAPGDPVDPPQQVQVMNDPTIPGEAVPVTVPTPTT